MHGLHAVRSQLPGLVHLHRRPQGGEAPDKPGGRVRVRATLDRFDIDYALCMYCGICVEVCPFDALFWSPDYEYSENHMGKMMHDMDRLQDWLATVPPDPGPER